MIKRDLLYHASRVADKKRRRAQSYIKCWAGALAPAQRASTQKEAPSDLSASACRFPSSARAYASASRQSPTRFFERATHCPAGLPSPRLHLRASRAFRLRCCTMGLEALCLTGFVGCLALLPNLALACSLWFRVPARAFPPVPRRLRRSVARLPACAFRLLVSPADISDFSSLPAAFAPFGVAYRTSRGKTNYTGAKEGCQFPKRLFRAVWRGRWHLEC